MTKKYKEIIKRIHNKNLEARQENVYHLEQMSLAAYELGYQRANRGLSYKEGKEQLISTLKTKEKIEALEKDKKIKGDQ